MKIHLSKEIKRILFFINLQNHGLTSRINKSNIKIKTVIKLWEVVKILYSLSVRIWPFQGRVPGSIPGTGNLELKIQILLYTYI